MSKIASVLNALSRGEELTAKQIASRFRYASPNSARKAVSNIRDAGYDVDLVERVNSKGDVTRKYRLAN